MEQKAAHSAEPQAQPEADDLFGEALNRVRLDWPDVGQYEQRMWDLADWFSDRDALTVKRYEMYLVALYLLAKLMYGPQGADVDAVIKKPPETVH
jgi:hypothetical protein